MDLPRHRQFWLHLVAVALAASAWWGSIGLITGLLVTPNDLSQRLPLQSPVLAGLALAAVVALPSTVLVVMVLRHDPRRYRFATFTGIVLIAWILVELAITRSFSILQPVYVSVGAGLVVAGIAGNGGFGPSNPVLPRR